MSKIKREEDLRMLPGVRKEFLREELRENEKAFLNMRNINISDEMIQEASAEELIRMAVEKAFGAATAQGSLVAHLQTPGDYNKHFEEIVKLFIAALTGSRIASYRAWHSALCEKLIELNSDLLDKKGNARWSYGNSQKIVNLVVKYVVVFTHRLLEIAPNHPFVAIGKKFTDCLAEIDIPIDSFIYEAFENWNKTYASDKIVLPTGERGQRIAWSRLNKEQYLALVESMHAVFDKNGVIPFEWEGIAWVEVKNDRKAKAKNKKKTKGEKK